jgi:hypothetical protein
LTAIDAATATLRIDPGIWPPATNEGGMRTVRERGVSVKQSNGGDGLFGHLLSLSVQFRAVPWWKIERTIL